MVRVIKSRRLRWARHVERMKEIRDSYKRLVYLRETATRDN
jgi:hypothetical protein